MKIPKGRKLIIFDFDETLCKTNGLIKRTYRSKNFTDSEDFLTPGEYSEWRETGEYNRNPSAWDLDFKSFTGYPSEGEKITVTFSALNSYLKQEEKYTVALVTGRDELSGPHKFLLKNNIDVDKMIFLCSGDPNKRMCFESLICTLNPSSVKIYEDGTAYINQCSEVCQKYNLQFTACLIKNGEIIKNNFS